MKFSFFFQIFVFSVSDVSPRVQDSEERKQLHHFLSLTQELIHLVKHLYLLILLCRFHVIG